jgi:hypothetical protein
VQGITQTARKIDHAPSDFIVSTLSIQNHGMTVAKTIGHFLNVIKSNGLDRVGFALS